VLHSFRQIAWLLVIPIPSNALQICPKATRRLVSLSASPRSIFVLTCLRHEGRIADNRKLS
jgi:hypothetical protein